MSPRINLTLAREIGMVLLYAERDASFSRDMGKDIDHIPSPASGGKVLRGEVGVAESEQGLPSTAEGRDGNEDGELGKVV